MSDLANWKPRPAPQPVTLEGRYVSIRPCDRAAHLEALWQAFGGLDINTRLQYFAQDDFGGIEDFDTWLTAVQKSGWVTEVFVDKASGEVVGLANYMRPDPANGVVEVGGVAHSFAMARSPLSTEVHYLMAKHAFEDLGYRRYEWKCDNRNEASKKTAVRLGFSFEGVFRQHMLSKRANRDTAWFSMIDKEWPLLNAAFEAWLSPDNFNADGTQKRRLEDIRAALA
ncbi:MULTISPECIES: GNAT family N-acetyltransferase [unclassified Rhizobium]|uniref:GNAT family N-acetyltransferase n=1 Tax=unclassified Rhizobium TaxID=2613769 RepID=UPI00071381E3|nr:MULTISPECIES: GNAT family protein [unclassified Rhizobium]KQS89633.1 acetyltransferase [Rhizobium sp. Leaf391]KQS94913.1 acetyltransferase [Rhizobium sp. Leaf386]KQU01289.1 acetyltransferase [Rhizobium sp. Leaf453]